MNDPTRDAASSAQPSPTTGRKSPAEPSPADLTPAAGAQDAAAEACAVESSPARAQPLSVRQALAQAASHLSGEEARREAELLLVHVLEVGRAWLFAHADDALEAPAAARFSALVEARRGGQPVAYLLGWREFYGLRLEVSPATLIPRHDTETLVEQALAHLPQQPGLRVLDLGTGSGAIALALAHTRPELEVWASDASIEALTVAQSNAKALGLTRVQFVQGDWFAPFAGQQFDLLLSNPPYIEADDPHLQQGDLRFEPASALASGADGFDDLRRIVEAAPTHLQPGGWLLFEHGADQGEAARALLVRRGFAQVFSARDLEARERVSGGCWADG
jgi:release factor glutamine methyltransferase